MESEAEKSLIVDALELRGASGLGIAPDNYLALRNSAFAHTLKIFSDSLERSIGYISWANIDRASFDRVVRTGQLPKYPFEWAEGRICMVLDVHIAGIGKFEAIRQLRSFIRSNRAIVPVRTGKPLRLYLRKGTWFVSRKATSLKKRAASNA
jgi:hemolysin-activating ACP:hemolysin acyltransferase